MVRTGRNEADTCKDYVLPALEASGWDRARIVDQFRITDGRVVFQGRRPTRKEQVRADYVLELSAGLSLAVVEAKREYALPGDGLQQAKDYAALLDLPVALSTNGHGIVEFDFQTGRQRELEVFPRPDELWERYRAWKGLADDDVADVMRLPFNRVLRNVDGSVREPRYYQRVAIHRAVAAILTNRKRLLLTMATGTGKTFTAVQIVWKVWRYWQALGQAGTRRVLYLADRDSLVKQPLEKEFRPVFGDDVHRLLGEVRGDITTSRNIYFSTYQALHDGSDSPPFQEFGRDYFDLIIVDECHRGSAREESLWRDILDYFDSATQLGLTATPKADTDIDTYGYFGRPLYSYSLSQGIEDGFLAPYRVRRVILSPDAHGWRPEPGQLDRFGRDIPDDLYSTSDFERVVSLLTRTEVAAQYLTNYLRATDRMAKMVIFCVDSEHALDMRNKMVEANEDLTRQQPEYVARIVSAERHVQALQERFQNEETALPVVATTARLLTTGVDIPTLRTVVLFRPIRSIVEFKQIIGRGTRLAPDFDKHAFEIIDFTGATVLFEDSEFDGPADVEVEDVVDERGVVITEIEVRESSLDEAETAAPDDVSDMVVPPYARKLYVDDADVYLTAQAVYMTDPGTDRLRLVEYSDYVAQVVRRMFPTPAGLRRRWREAPSRAEVAEELRQHGIDLEEVSERANLPDADAFDVLVHVAWNEPVVSRYERARRVRRDNGAFFRGFAPEAREVLDLLLERYAEHGVEDLADLRALELEPVNDLGTVVEIARRFGNPDRLRQAVGDLQRMLYVA